MGEVRHRTVILTVCSELHLPTCYRCRSILDLILTQNSLGNGNTNNENTLGTNDEAVFKLGLVADEKKKRKKSSLGRR